MISAYLDASVVLRIILREENPLKEWDDLEFGVASHIMQVECLRTLHRLWLQRQLDDSEYEEKVARAATMMRYLDVIPIDENVIASAKGPLPVALTSLDAVHLASAMVYRKGQPSDERPVVFATHDVRLAHAAKAMHFEVIGVTL